MFGLILLLCILLLISWILFAPIIIRIDSNQGIFLFQWQSIGYAQIRIWSDQLLFQFRILFFRKEIDLLTYNFKKDKKPKKEKRKKTRQKRSDAARWLKKIPRAIKSFKVKVFRLNLDTDNYIHNAYLWPVFYALKNDKRHLSINFDGEFEFQFLAKGQVFRILKSFIL